MNASCHTYFGQAAAVQRAGAVACIIVNMEGSRKICAKTLAFHDEVTRDDPPSDRGVGREGHGTHLDASAASNADQSDCNATNAGKLSPSDILELKTRGGAKFAQMFAMPTNEEAHDRMPVTIPVLMVEYADKRHFTDSSVITLQLVDVAKRITLDTWPYRALSLNDVPDDVNTDRKCVSNMMMIALHRIRHDLTAVGSTMFDPGVWTKDEVFFRGGFLDILQRQLAARCTMS